MKIIQSTDDIRKAAELVTLPSIDVRQNVMQKIYRRKEKQTMKRSKRILLVIAATVFFTIAAGFTAVKVWELKGPGGLPFKYSLFSENSKELSAELLEQRNAQWEKVQPGGALAVLRTKNNPENVIGVTFKPLVTNDPAELEQKIGDAFKEPASLPEGYSFKEGQLNWGINDQIRTSMLEEAKETEKDSVIRIIEPSGSISSYSLIYTGRGGELNISLNFDFVGDELNQPDTGNKVTKIKMGGFEAIYTEGDGRSEIKWIDGQDKIMYAIGCPQGNIDQNELVKVAESLK